jgi:hypothetical protein
MRREDQVIVETNAARQAETQASEEDREQTGHDLLIFLGL